MPEPTVTHAQAAELHYKAAHERDVLWRSEVTDRRRSVRAKDVDVTGATAWQATWELWPGYKFNEDHLEVGRDHEDAAFLEKYKRYRGEEPSFSDESFGEDQSG